jgi:hypothetical protein
LSLAVGVLAIVACVVGWAIDPILFFRSYLASFVFWVGLALGSLGVLMMQYVTGGRWGRILQRPLESAALTLPLLAILLIPILVGMHDLYPWTNADVMAADPVLQKKQVYLNVPFFIGRQIAYFVIWIAFAWLLDRWAKEWNRTEQPRYQWRLEHLSAAGMFVLAATITLAIVDWVMSLEPRWYSTIYAIVYIAGELLAGFAFAIPAVILLSPNYSESLSARRFRDMGNLLLTFVMLWAYCSFSQYLLIWSGNLREEITWYLPRTTGSWGIVALVLIGFHFFVPFFLLLFRDLKQSRKILSALAIFLLLMRLVDVFWFVKPAFPAGEPIFNWMDAASFVGIGGIWLALFLGIYGGKQNSPAEGNS